MLIKQHLLHLFFGCGEMEIKLESKLKFDSETINRRMYDGSR